MREEELIIFIVLMTLLLMVLLGGLLIFLFQYRKRKLLFEKEKAMTEKQHQLDLLNTQINSQQLTMLHIGREIHDNVGQKLTLASLYCRQITELKQTGTINQLIDESLQELRRLSKSLSTTDQFERTLAQLIQTEADLINAGGICKIVIEETTDFPVLQALQTHLLFRILQEFIQNSLKHAACTTIRIQLLAEAQQICILATDNGQGFDLANHSAGLGLYTMRQRALELQASFELSSTPGGGTSLCLKLAQVSIVDQP